ncbi:hypothetical protein [Streptomyces sp. bgisy154]|uniref:hypothetical protein n=1 Tax=Streptomyces sp. bgisy154 TaxID=3413794 RepID=UPI003D731E4A
MYLVYQPEGSAEPQRWRYNPRKLMSADREKIERLTGVPFAEATQLILKGHALCRRALLFTFLRRDHRGLRFEDVDFAWDELTLQYSKGEYERMRQDLIDSGALHGGELDAALAKLDEEMATAFEDPEEEGKALRPIAE